MHKLFVLLILITLVACGGRQVSPIAKKTAAGTVAGAGVGAIVGSVISNGNIGESALLGAGIGAGDRCRVVWIESQGEEA